MSMSTGEVRPSPPRPDTILLMYMHQHETVDKRDL